MKKTHYCRVTALALTLSMLPQPQPAAAGTEVEGSGKDKIIEPVKKELPYGTITFGEKFSDDLQTAYVDSITPFWAPGDFVMFLNTRTKWSDNSQLLSSYGLGTRYLVPDHEIILGVNAFYDSIHSRHGNDFDQLGVGVELLTRWFDARANWYVPDNDIYEVGRGTQRDGDLSVVGDFRDGNALKRRYRETSDKRYTKRWEGALEGYNLEAGFLVPGVDKYFELRLLAGYYNYSGPFDKHYEGFKARAEARILPGLIADVEYWDDAFLMGGHWTGEVKVSIPFSIFNLAKGRNPFEGTAEMFRFRQRDFRERLSEQVIRSHTVQTTDSGNVGAGGSSNSNSFDQITGLIKPVVNKPVGATAPPPPPAE
jgi:hypothetical protein